MPVYDHENLSYRDYMQDQGRSKLDTYNDQKHSEILKAFSRNENPNKRGHLYSEKFLKTSIGFVPNFKVTQSIE